MKCCKFVSHHATFWHCCKRGRCQKSSVSTTMTLICMDSVTCCQSPLNLAVSSFVLPPVRSCKPRRSVNRKKCYTWGKALSGMKILADFDKLISKKTDKTRLMFVITNSMADLSRSFFVRTIGCPYSTLNISLSLNVQPYAIVRCLGEALAFNQRLEKY